MPCGGGTCVQPSSSGWTLGGHIGYNWQAPGSIIVLGIEADLNWLDLSASAPCGAPVFTCGTSVDWQASVRGRAGVTIAPMLLVYVTGGVAFSELKGFADIFRASSSRTGWIVGLGADWAVTNNWFFGVEWLHADFGKADHFYDDIYPAIPLKTDQVRARLTFRR